ncbi:MAG: glycosyltransferase family 39 protein, partial [Chloroflexi bacterium]|nr:glycosyltransferase family 39 protein [Chloroflexota bacterium]
NGRVPGYFDDVPPQPDAVIFQIEPIAVAVGLYLIALLLQKFFRARALDALAIFLAVSTLAWASAEYFGQRARGVTGSDPYAYVQMGIDLATRGSPLHQFNLFSTNSQLPISWFPFVHVGYHLPNPQTGDAATVWSPGGSVAFAVVYRALGEEGLYWVNPIFSLLTLAAIALLAREIFRDENPRNRIWIIALAIFLWATSSTVVAWAVVPMVDAQAALFSTLAIYFAFKTSHALRFTHYAIFSGVSLAFAYDIRHTQVLLAIPIAYLILSNEKSRRARLFALMAAGISALVVALPDLIYHQTIFGSWLTPESEELGLFSFSALAQTLSAFADRFFAAYEFGWLAPFLFYGAYRLARDKRREFIALFIFVFCLFTFHFFYPALRLRDLLPEFPAVIIMTAYGFVAWIEILLRGARARHKVAAA